VDDDAVVLVGASAQEAEGDDAMAVTKINATPLAAN
jgi:hypothetical protein